MSRGLALAAARRAAERGMTDACRITRTRAGTTNPATGQVTRTPTTVYEGRCRVQQSPTGTAGTETNVGAAQVRLVATVLQLPVTTSTGVQVGDQVEILTATNDMALVGRKYNVVGPAGKSEASARRLAVQEVTG